MHTTLCPEIMYYPTPSERAFPVCRDDSCGRYFVNVSITWCSSSRVCLSFTNVARRPRRTRRRKCRVSDRRRRMNVSTDFEHYRSRIKRSMKSRAFFELIRQRYSDNRFDIFRHLCPLRNRIRRTFFIIMYSVYFFLIKYCA